MFTAAFSSSAGRWRTAFLSLRDDISTTPPPPVPLLLEDLLLSHSHSLLSAVSLLPLHELTSDCLFLPDLVSKADGPEWIPVSLHTCQLVHDVCACACVLVQQNSSSWPLLLRSFASVLEILLRQPMPGFRCIFLQNRTCDAMFRDSKTFGRSLPQKWLSSGEHSLCQALRCSFSPHEKAICFALKKRYIELEGQRSNLVQTAWALLGLIQTRQAERDPSPLHLAAKVIVFYIYYVTYKSIFPLWALAEYRKVI